MNTIRKSIIWKISDEDFIKLVKSSQTMSQVLRFFGMENKGSNYITCRKRIKELDIDTSHFLNRVQSSNLSREITKDEFIVSLCENSSCKRSEVKKRLVKFNLLDYTCSECGNVGIWNNKKLSLHLEHKNGVSNDNRLENLTFLCPNCHSQTDTYAGKSHKKHYFCIQCKNPCGGYSDNNICLICAGKKQRKCNRPTKEELQTLLKEKPVLQIAKVYKVRDNTIRKWCSYYGIDCKIESSFSKFNKIK